MELAKVIIAGGGPAGLTAAYELCRSGKPLQPAIYEMSDQLGGLSRTVRYQGNRLDIGGHRFFSKSDRVMSWWLEILPLQGAGSAAHGPFELGYQGARRRWECSGGPDPDVDDKVMLVRRRLSRILFLGQLFDYPLKLTLTNARKLGIIRILRIGASYLRARLVPIAPERTLEDFFINRFGRELYQTFFKSYSEKVWGRPCRELSAEWGAQRVKGVSVGAALRDALQKRFCGCRNLAQKEIETSLIEYFLYPKLGPGQMWEEVGRRIEATGGEIHLRTKIVGIELTDGRITAVTTEDSRQMRRQVAADYLISSMPVRDLVAAMADAVPAEARAIARRLSYRDFITVGVLLKRTPETRRATAGTLEDNWIYVQEAQVKVGRIQLFGNWSPYLTADRDTVWLGLEYFCCKGDSLWELSDEELGELAVNELSALNLARSEDVLATHVVRAADAYPVYDEGYAEFDHLRRFLDGIPNLYLVGRNGMHRYNNQDHSMLTAMKAVEQLVSGDANKDAIWQVNVEQEYHEASVAASSVRDWSGEGVPSEAINQETVLRRTGLLHGAKPQRRTGADAIASEPPHSGEKRAVMR